MGGGKGKGETFDLARGEAFQNPRMIMLREKGEKGRMKKNGGRIGASGDFTRKSPGQAGKGYAVLNQAVGKGKKKKKKKGRDDIRKTEVAKKKPLKSRLSRGEKRPRMRRGKGEFAASSPLGSKGRGKKGL